MINFFWKHCFIVILYEWVKAWLLTKVDASELCSTRPQANEDLLVPDFPLGERFLASLLTYILHNLASIRKNTHTKPTNSNEVWCKKAVQRYVGFTMSKLLWASQPGISAKHLSRASQPSISAKHLSQASQPSISAKHLSNAQKCLAILKNAQHCSTMLRNAEELAF